MTIAGGYYEKTDGGGYPRSISTRDLPLAARMMAISDIFEALTLSDRLYKKVKTLSEALKVMQCMVEDRHIDKDLFRLFVNSGKTSKYPRKYLLKEQQYEVNIAELFE